LRLVFLVWYGYLEDGFERRLLATVRWTVATAVAFPQKSESVLMGMLWRWMDLISLDAPASNFTCDIVADFTLATATISLRLFRFKSKSVHKKAPATHDSRCYSFSNLIISPTSQSNA